MKENCPIDNKSVVETIIKRLCENRLDITEPYDNWLRIGFAFADEFGECGRQYYHSVSQFHPQYSSKECDEQYNACLKSHGRGVTIATFIQYAKNAGIDIRCHNRPYAQTTQTAQMEQTPHTEESEKLYLPIITPTVVDKLPSLLKSIVEKGNSEADADMLLLGTITALSSIFPNMHGIYDQREVYPNLFLFVTAPASSGKGRLSFCKRIIDPIHKMKREQAEQERQEYLIKVKEGDKSEPIDEPKQKMLIIPANTSCTGFYQLLNDNDGQGIIFETEGDTLSKTFKSDYGDYSDGFRKGFHHESISYNRRKDREFVEVMRPKFSVLLSGTPKQIKTLITDTENGLFSRFMFYYLNTPVEWHNVFSKSNDEPLDSFFDQIGKQVLEHYNYRQNNNVLFEITESQVERFNQFFSAQQDSFIESCGIEMLGSIRRLGLVAFRIAMILSELRTMDTGEDTCHLVCNDVDFECSIEIVKCLMAHTEYIYSTYYQSNNMKESTFLKQRLLDTLPQQFNTKVYYEIATSLGINKRTADGYLQKWTKKGTLTRKQQGFYFKNPQTSGYYVN